MLQVNNVSFSYSKEKNTLKNVSFNILKGEHLCIMGESGCGKSTLLKVIYGLLDIDDGTIFWDNNEILGPAHHLVPGMDFFKYVAQDFDLMPYITVSENIKKFLSRFFPKEAEERTQELLDVIEMTELANTKVKNLSGGQQQRVAIARALAKEPELLLLDEPFSQIDNFKKNSLRRKLFKYLKDKNIACIVATHDGNDALSFADKMIVIRNQQIIAYDTPMQLYNYTEEKYVAALFDDVNEVRIDNNQILVYPHQIKLVDTSTIKGVVTNSYYKGYYWLIEVLHKNDLLFFNHNKALEKEKTVFLEIENRLKNQ
ncbi:ABC transporter ATP-binding protein [Tenacibaculum sp. 190130A14a]